MAVLYTTYVKQSFHGAWVSRAGVFQLSVYFVMIFTPFVMGFASHSKSTSWPSELLVLESPAPGCLWLVCVCVCV